MLGNSRLVEFAAVAVWLEFWLYGGCMCGSLAESVVGYVFPQLPNILSSPAFLFFSIPNMLSPAVGFCCCV